MKEFFFLRDVCFRRKKSTSSRKNHKTIEEVLSLQEGHLGRLTQLTLNINGNHTSMRLQHYRVNSNPPFLIPVTDHSKNESPSKAADS